MKKTFVSLLLVFAVVFLSAQVNLNKPIPSDPTVIYGKLDNGLVYYIKKNKKPENRAEFRLFVNAGAINETDAQQGLAHFVEHMAFNGTEHFPGDGELIKYLESAGIKFGQHSNAYTSFDETVYSLLIPTDKKEVYDKAYLVLEDYAGHLLFKPEEIEKERGVILSELLARGNNAGERVQKQYLPIILQDHLYAHRLPGGKRDIVKNCPHKALTDFYADWYRPNLMAVVVVGDIDVKEAEAKIKAHFSKLKNPSNEKERKNYIIPNNEEPIITIHKDKELPNSAIQIWFKEYEYSKPVKTYNDYKKSLIRSIASTLINNRLSEIKEKTDAPFMSAGLYNSGMFSRSNKAMLLYMANKKNEYLESIKTSFAEIKRVKDFGFTKTELDREIKAYMSRTERFFKEADKTNSSYFVGQYVQNYRDGSTYQSIEDYYKMINEILPTITINEVNKALDVCNFDKNMITLIIAPEQEDIKLPTVEQIKNTIKEVKAIKLEAYKDNVSSSPLFSKQLEAGKIISKKENEKFDYTEYKLENGATVVLKSTDFKNDQIIFEAHRYGGISLYEDKDMYSAWHSNSIVDNAGISSFDKTQLKKMLKGKNMSVGSNVGFYDEGFSGYSNQEDFELMLQILHLNFTDIREDKEAFESYMSKNKNEVLSYENAPQVHFYKELFKVVSGQENPRSLFNIYTPYDKLDQIKYEDAYRIFKERFSDVNDFKFVFVGNFDKEKIMPLIQKYIGSLPSSDVAEKFIDRGGEFPTKKTIKKVRKGQDEKSTVAILFNGKFDYENRKERLDFYILGQILNIRLRENLREDKGGVYGVGVSFSTDKIPNPEYSIFISFQTEPIKIKMLTKNVFDELNKIKAEPVTQEEIDKVVEMSIEQRETNVKKNAFWLDYIMSVYTEGKTLENLDDFTKLLKAITIEDIKTIANKYIDVEKFVQLSLLPE